MWFVRIIEQTLFDARIKRHGLDRFLSIFSDTTPSERLALFELARFLRKDARALEIGSHLGSSALFLCAGLTQIGGRLLCVDTWMNQTMPDGERDTFPEFLKNTERFAELITPIRKFSSDLSEKDLCGTLDLVFIDGDHSEGAVRADFHFAARHVEIGGKIAFHDCSGAFPGVSIVVGEALASADWQLIRFIDSLAVIRRVRHTAQ